MIGDKGKDQDLQYKYENNCNIPAIPAFEQGWFIVLCHSFCRSGKRDTLFPFPTELRALAS
jgi:hypothetical protein